MMKITFAVAIAAAVLMPAPLLVGAIPAEAQNLKMAQVDVQIGRNRDRRRGDQGTTVGVGPKQMAAGTAGVAGSRADLRCYAQSA
jgi:hypothetical protein